MAPGGELVKRDLVIGILGATLLVAAMVGIFQLRAGTPTGAAWDVEWTTASEAGPAVGGQTRESQTSAARIELTALNVTRATFALVWTDDVGAPDAFELTVTAPDGTTRTGRGEEGRVEVVFEGLARLPTPMRLFANDAEDAEAQLARTQTSRAAAGAWRAQVRLLDAGDERTPVGDLVITQDVGNAWKLETRLDVYKVGLKAA